MYSNLPKYYPYFDHGLFIGKEAERSLCFDAFNISRHRNQTQGGFFVEHLNHRVKEIIEMQDNGLL